MFPGGVTAGFRCIFLLEGRGKSTYTAGWICAAGEEAAGKGLPLGFEGAAIGKEDSRLCRSSAIAGMPG